MPILERIRSMPAGRQIVLAVGVILIAGFVLGSVYFVFLRPPDSVLFSNLKPLDAATIVAELDKRKVPYHLADGGTTILVAKNQVDSTRLSILSQDLPLKGTVGFELFNKSDIGLTEFEQRINYQRALQGELQRTIMALDEIDTARVHLSLPEPTIFREDQRAPKASVALTLKPGKELTPSAVSGIQRMVAAAVPDLEAANVVVVDDQGQVISADAPVVVHELPGQRAAESWYETRVRQALSTTYPGQTFTVKVTAVAAYADGTDDTASGNPFAGWTPQNRHFPLKVDVTSVAASEVEAQQNIQSAAEAAISDDPDLGDEIIVTTPQAAVPEAVAAPAAPAVVSTTVATATQPAASLASQKITSSIFWSVVALTALIGLTFSGVQLLRLRPPLRRLSDAERRDFATRFQTLLQEGGADGI